MAIPFGVSFFVQTVERFLGEQQGLSGSGSTARMEFFRVYGRVIGLLRDERGLAIMLALANVAVAALQFYEPVLFGKVVDLLSNATDRATEMLWHDASELLVLWAVVGLGGIVANIVVSLQADRMAHRRRLGAMATLSSSTCWCCPSRSTTPSIPAGCSRSC